MAGAKDNEFTFNARGLSKSEAKALRDRLVREKNRIAPKSKASIAVGKWDNFSRLMGKCRKELKEG